jgi:catechol 2,3-dioxygenase-like lactoylglutathione lyase family enzyme
MAGLHHTGLTVRDLDRSLAFYRDVLGMEVLFEQEKQGGYLAAIVGYPEAHVRMAHLAFPGDGHRVGRVEFFTLRSGDPERDGGARSAAFGKPAQGRAPARPA